MRIQAMHAVVARFVASCFRSWNSYRGHEKPFVAGSTVHFPESHFDLFFLAVTLNFERHLIARLLQVKESDELLERSWLRAVDLQDDIFGFETRFGRSTIGQDFHDEDAFAVRIETNLHAQIAFGLSAGRDDHQAQSGKKRWQHHAREHFITPLSTMISRARNVNTPYPHAVRRNIR